MFTVRYEQLNFLPNSSRAVWYSK